MHTNARQAVIVLGSGRSGTSLLMQFLVAAGLYVSDNLIPTNASNTEGFYEDIEIKNIHVDLQSCLNTTQYLPLPKNWHETDCFQNAKLRLSQSIQRLLDLKTGLLGIKDPQISTFLPLWVKSFNSLRVVPLYILAIRDPRSVITSFMRQYGTPSHIAELTWLLRTLNAIDNTASDCFIAHYEKWFSDPEPLAQELLKYTGLSTSFKGEIHDLLAKIIKPNLNRAEINNYTLQNSYIEKIYNTLKECNGTNYDKNHLRHITRKCLLDMDCFKGWYQFAHMTNKKLSTIQKRLQKESEEAAKVKDMRMRIQKLEMELENNRRLIAKLESLKFQIDHIIKL